MRERQKVSYIIFTVVISSFFINYGIAYLFYKYLNLLELELMDFYTSLIILSLFLAVILFWLESNYIYEDEIE